MVRIPNQLDQKENDVEHSYALAMAGWFLAPYFPHLDESKIIRYALAHDLVEIHAGDTFAYGEQQHIDTKKAREQAAAEQLSREWPDFPDLHEAIRDYEERADAEAKFVYALDKIMPALMNRRVCLETPQHHLRRFPQRKRKQDTRLP